MSSTLMTLLDFSKVHNKLGQGEIILDVRNPDEFAQSHIPGAKNIPVSEVAQHAAELKQHKKIYIHCKRGGRAKTAFEALKNAGLDNLICIHDAGMDAWIENGLPTKQG